MRRKPWSTEEVKEAEAIWEKAKAATGSQAFEQLASLLSHGHKTAVQTELLVSLCGSENRKKRYQTFNIPKRRGGKRTIEVPEPTLRWVQSCLLQAFSSLFRPHKCAHGFVAQRGILSHAKVHAGHKWVFVTDIKDFFPLIHWGRIFGMLQNKPIESSLDMARIIANLTTYKGHLPQGAPTSPLLSNLICRRMDHALYSWAIKNGYRYSRYADDLAFSTNKANFPQTDRDHIEALVTAEGFQINASKRRLVPARSRQLLTGLVVNGGQPNVKREVAKNLRALLHNVVRHGWDTQVNRAVHFMDFAQYQQYRAKSLSLAELTALREKQKTEHLLISPLVSLFKPVDVLTFQKVVRGKLAFVAQIKGPTSKSYLRLQNLAEQAFRGVSTTIFDDLHNEDFYKGETIYRNFKKSVYDAETISELRSILAKPSEVAIVEFSWSLPASAAVNAKELYQLREHLLRIKFSSLRSAKYTAHFFSYFVLDGYFKSLLHSPDSTTDKFESILDKCKALFESLVKRLPNRLQVRVAEFLSACSKAVIKHPGKHLWEVPECLNSIILPFKRDTRFDEGMHEATDIENMFSELKTELAPTLGNSVNRLIFKIEKFRLIFTDVAAVREGVKRLLESIISNSTSTEITVTSELTDATSGKLGKYSIHISDPDGIIDDAPEINKFFGHKLRKALEHLRGYAEWYISATFKDGTSYLFDVMRNSRTETGSHSRSFQHTVTFYRYEA